MGRKRSKVAEFIRSLLEEAERAVEKGEEGLLRAASCRIQKTLSLLRREALPSEETRTLLVETRRVAKRASSKLDRLRRLRRGKGGERPGFIDFEV